MEALELFRTIMAFVFGTAFGATIMYVGPIIVEKIDERREEEE